MLSKSCPNDPRCPKNKAIHGTTMILVLLRHHDLPVTSCKRETFVLWRNIGRLIFHVQRGEKLFTCELQPRIWISTLLRRHNGRDGVRHHQPHHCLLTVQSGADQRKHQSSASVAFVRGIHRWPVNSPYKWPVTRKMFLFDYATMSHPIFTARHIRKGLSKTIWIYLDENCIWIRGLWRKMLKL